jgi:PKD repeat protein
VLGGYFHVADTPLDDDIYAAKVDAQDGSVVWERRYGSTNDQAGWSCVPHSPGRHLLIGNTQAGSGNYDALALLIDTDGDSIVLRTYGNASDHETFYFGQAAAGGGFVAAGSTGLFGGGDQLAVADTMPPVAAFTASPRSGPAPLSVDFTDRSTFAASSWEWDFDDDGTPDAFTQNPTHVYTDPGAYTVVLTASDASGSRTRVKTRYVRVSCPEAPVGRPRRSGAAGGSGSVLRQARNGRHAEHAEAPAPAVSALGPPSAPHAARSSQRTTAVS